MRRRPRVLLVQSPSIVLAAFATALRRVAGYRIIVDAHNEAVEPYIHPSRAIKALVDWTMRRADLTIVTNSHLAKVVVARGGRPLVLPDPLPSPPAGQATELGGDFNVVVIATFAADEPLPCIFECAATLLSDAHFHVTGNSRRMSRELRALVPANVRLTGFLDDEAYWALLRGADAILDLTLMDNCLVCGAYEAIAVDKPLIVSDNPASRELFGEMGELVDNTTTGLFEAISRLRSRSSIFNSGGAARRHGYDQRWHQSSLALLAYISDPR